MKDLASLIAGLLTQYGVSKILTLYWVATHSFKKYLGSLFLTSLTIQLIGTLTAVSGLSLLVLATLYMSPQFLVELPWIELGTALGTVFLLSAFILYRSYRKISKANSDDFQVTTTLIAAEIEQVLLKILTPAPEEKTPESSQDIDDLKAKLKELQNAIDELNSLQAENVAPLQSYRARQ